MSEENAKTAIIAQEKNATLTFHKTKKTHPLTIKINIPTHTFNHNETEQQKK